MVRRLSSFFSGEFFKAADFPEPKRLTISKVEEVEVGREKERRLVVRFRGEAQSLVLNKVNGESIAELAETDDLDQWPGTAIVLYPSKTDFAGRRVDCIRVCGPSSATSAEMPVQAASKRRGRRKPRATKTRSFRFRRASEGPAGAEHSSRPQASVIPRQSCSAL